MGDVFGIAASCMGLGDLAGCLVSYGGAACRGVLGKGVRGLSACETSGAVRKVDAGCKVAAMPGLLDGPGIEGDCSAGLTVFEGWLNLGLGACKAMGGTCGCGARAGLGW